MSYVRWSTPIKLPDGLDGWAYMMNPESYPQVETSDFYIYEHVGGFISINLAGNRHRPNRKFEGSRLVDVNPETHCGKPSPEWMKWLHEGREDIDLPHAGETIEIVDPEEAIAKVEELIALGFRAPDWLVADMREELLPQAKEPS